MCCFIGVYVENLSTFVVRDTAEVLSLLKLGKKKLIFAETRMNRLSSRYCFEKYTVRECGALRCKEASLLVLVQCVWSCGTDALSSYPDSILRNVGDGAPVICGSNNKGRIQVTPKPVAVTVAIAATQPVKKIRL